MRREKIKMTIEVDAKDRERVEEAVQQVVNPRTRRLSLLFRDSDVAEWMALADKHGESLTGLIEKTMNALKEKNK